MFKKILCLFSLIFCTVTFHSYAELSKEETLYDLLGIRSSSDVQKAYMIDVTHGVGADLSEAQLSGFLSESKRLSLNLQANPNPFEGVAVVIETKSKTTTYFLGSGVEIGKYGANNYLCYATAVENDFLDELYTSFMSRTDKIPTETFSINDKNDYLELPGELYALGEVEFAAENSLLPYSVTNSFGKDITREEMCILMSNFICVYGNFTSLESYLRHKNIAYLLNSFSDCANADESISMLYALGIVNGIDNDNFDPYGAVTREQAAVMIKKLADVVKITGKEGNVNYSDGNDMSTWAYGGIAFVSLNGIMNGVGTNVFGPKTATTTEQAVIALNRLYRLNNNI